MTGEGVIGDAHNSEEQVLVSGEHRPEELCDVIDCIVGVTPGAHEDAPEAGNVSRGRLSDVIEAEARFCGHGTVCGHPHFGGSAGV